MSAQLLILTLFLGFGATQYAPSQAELPWMVGSTLNAEQPPASFAPPRLDGPAQATQEALPDFYSQPAPRDEMSRPDGIRLPNAAGPFASSVNCQKSVSPAKAGSFKSGRSLMARLKPRPFKAKS